MAAESAIDLAERVVRVVVFKLLPLFCGPAPARTRSMRHGRRSSPSFLIQFG